MRCVTRPKASSRAILIGARFVLIGLPLATPGCSTPTAPTPPPSGGHVLVLDYDEFAQRVEPVLSRHGCDAGGDCHGGGIRGTLALSPETAKNVRYDFDQASLQVSTVNADSSKLLRKPLALAAGGLPHAVKPFASTADSDYVAIRQWILDGVLR